MNSLKIFLRRSMAIALLSIPMETLAGDDRRIALAFDSDAQSGVNEALLDELEKLDIKATVISTSNERKGVPGQPGAIAETLRASSNPHLPHSNLMEVAAPGAEKEISSAKKILRELGYKDSSMFRPPCELLPGAPISERQKGISSTDWDKYPDTNAAMHDPQAIADYLKENAFDGAVILLHQMYNHREQILKALPLISQKLKAEGYRFVTLSELTKNIPESKIS